MRTMDTEDTLGGDRSIVIAATLRREIQAWQAA